MPEEEYLTMNEVAAMLRLVPQRVRNIGRSSPAIMSRMGGVIVRRHCGKYHSLIGPPKVSVLAHIRSRRVEPSCSRNPDVEATLFSKAPAEL